MEVFSTSSSKWGSCVHAQNLPTTYTRRQAPAKGPYSMRTVAVLLLAVLSCALAQPSPQRKVTACQSPGTTCATCTSRYIASDNDCGWCGSVTEGSTSGLCVSQADYKVNPRQCLPLLPPQEGYRTGPPESACLPLAEYFGRGYTECPAAWCQCRIQGRVKNATLDGTDVSAKSYGADGEHFAPARLSRRRISDFERRLEHFKRGVLQSPAAFVMQHVNTAPRKGSERAGVSCTRRNCNSNKCNSSNSNSNRKHPALYFFATTALARVSHIFNIHFTVTFHPQPVLMCWVRGSSVGTAGVL